MKLVATFVLALSLCVLSGAASSSLAMVENFSHSGDCCPAEQQEGQEAGDGCVSPECQCLSCLTIDLQQVFISLAGAAESDSTHHETIASLSGGSYSTIDYPPEAA